MAHVVQEVKLVKEFFADSQTIQGVRYDEDERNLYFTFVHGKKKIRFQFYVPYNYPDDPSPDERPVLMQEEGLHDDLVEQINEFSREGGSLINAMQLIVTMLTKKFSLKASRDHSQMSSLKVQPMELEKKPEKGKRKADEEEEGDIEDDDGIVPGHPLLRQHVEETEDYFGKGSVKYFPELSMVRLFVDTSFMSEGVASALGVDCHIPVNISLHFSEDYLSSPVPPTFEIDQKPRTDFGLQFQLTEILRNWLKQNWGRTTYSMVPGPTGSDSSSSSGSSGSSGVLGKIFGRKGKEAVSTAEGGSEDEEVYEPEKKYPAQYKELLDMGFEKDIICYALHTTAGNVSEALNFCVDPQPWFKEEAKKARSGKKRALSRSQASKAKNNLLIALVLYIRSRIGNCSNFCPICDSKHACDGLKPIVCAKPDCVWRYEELGLGANVNSEISRAPEVVDLLISLAVSAAGSGRGDQVFDPFPSDFLNGTTKDFNRLKTVLEDFPPVSELKVSSEIRALLDKKDPNPPQSKCYYRLLRWLLTSNRAHLVRLDEEHQIKEMATPYQYMLLMSTPEKEARFTQLKNTHGSFFAFHGSPMENWHSILHNGLRNMSNTKGMLHGAAHGAGIYLAPNAGTSQGYMRSGSGWSKSIFGVAVSCLAMCEVIDHPTLYGRDHNQWCYVAKEDDHVMTRFFFIYASTTSFPSGVNARSLKVPDMNTFRGK